MLPFRLGLCLCYRAVTKSSLSYSFRNKPASPGHLRFLSSSSPVRKPDDPKPNDASEALSALRDSPVFQKIAQNPEALALIQNFAQLLQKRGIDTGKPLSMAQTAKLMLDSEFRQASKDLMEGLNKAGIDLNAKEFMDELAKLNKSLVSKP